MDVAVASAADEALLLDLLNTTPVADGLPRDDLEDPKVAKAWMREHGITATRAELAALVDVRSLLQAVVRGKRSPAALRPYLDAVALRARHHRKRRRLAARHHRGRNGRRARGAGVGRTAHHQPGPVARVRQQRVPTVSDRPQQAQYRPLVLDGHLRQPDEGAQALSARTLDTEQRANRLNRIQTGSHTTYSDDSPSPSNFRIDVDRLAVIRLARTHH